MRNKYKYIITSAYTGQSKEIFGDRSDRGSVIITIYENDETVAIVPLVGFMIEISMEQPLSDAEKALETLKNRYEH